MQFYVLTRNALRANWALLALLLATAAIAVRVGMSGAVFGYAVGAAAAVMAAGVFLRRPAAYVAVAALAFAGTCAGLMHLRIAVIVGCVAMLGLAIFIRNAFAGRVAGTPAAPGATDDR